MAAGAPPASATISRRLSQPTSVSLDVIRAAAAALVMLYHLRHLFFVDASQLQHPNLVVRGLYFVTGLGHEAVMVFFVLSGLLISLSVFRSRAEGRWSLAEYAIQRLSRLWVVLIPALLLGGVLDQVGMHLFHATGVYSGLPADRSVLDLRGPDHFTLRSFFGDALFLHETRLAAPLSIQRFGSNGPVWSLAYEFWYYMLFPALLIVFWRGPVRRRGLAVVAAAAIVVLVGSTIATYFGIWLLGVAVAVCPWPALPRAKGRAAAIVAAVLLVVITLLVSYATGVRFRSDVLIGLTFALLVYLLCSAGRTMRLDGALVRRLRAPAALFAGFSYTLYLVHMPALVFGHAWLLSLGQARWQPDGLHLALGLGIAAAIGGFAWTVARFTEFRTAEFRALIHRGLRRAADTGVRLVPGWSTEGR